MDIETKVLQAIHRIEELYLETNGKCYLSFSGGKDSTVILALIKMCSPLVIPENSIPAVFSNTGIELQATRKFVKWVKENYYPNVEMIRPEHSFSWVLENKGKPMKSKMKSELLERYQHNPNENTVSFGYLAITHKPNNRHYIKTKIADKDIHLVSPGFDIKISNKCCSILKKKPFEKYQKENEIKGYIVGERLSEGGARELNAHKREKEGMKVCTKTKGKYIVKMPIIDWTDDDIENFIKAYDVPLSRAYTEYGMKRTGCAGCPFNLHIADDLETLYYKEPLSYKASLFWLQDVYIAQNIKLPFDTEYEKKRKEKWTDVYSDMRYETMSKYRPEKAYKFKDKDKEISNEE